MGIRGQHGANILWPQAHKDELIRLAASLSRREIARALNEKYGTSYTRNAIVGQAMRLGLTQRAPAYHPAEVAARRKARQDRKNTVRREGRDSPAHRVRTFQPPRDQTILRCAEIEPRGVSVVEVSGCRWPYGDGPFTFCDHPIFQKKYCAAHFYLSIGDGTPSERAASRIPSYQLAGAR